MRYLIVVCMVVLAIVYRPRIVEHTRTVTVIRTLTIAQPHEHDPAPGSMTAREFDTIKIGQSADYLDRVYGDSYANVPNDHQDVWPAEGGGWYIAHYGRQKENNKVIGTEWRNSL